MHVINMASNGRDTIVTSVINNGSGRRIERSDGTSDCTRGQGWTRLLVALPAERREKGRRKRGRRRGRRRRRRVKRGGIGADGLFPFNWHLDPTAVTTAAVGQTCQWIRMVKR